MSFYTFRLGNKLVFVGPYPAYPFEPQPSSLDSDSSPVDRAKAATKMLPPRMGYPGKGRSRIERAVEEALDR